MKHDLTFAIYWLDNDFGVSGPGKISVSVVGRETVKRHDLTDAVTAANNKLRAGRGYARAATGFVVAVEAD